MKGEHRFDLKEILNTCNKGEYLAFSFFKTMDYNDILFRDLYDFFDSEDIKLYCCVEPIYNNHNLFWVHSIIEDIDENVIYSGESKKTYTTPTYFTEKKKFENRRDAEIEMFFLAFRKLEKILSDPERSKAEAEKIHNTTTVSTTRLQDFYIIR